MAAPAEYSSDDAGSAPGTRGWTREELYAERTDRVGLTAGLTFVDTNLLVYAEDGRDAVRRGIAVRVLSDLWASGLGVLSTQVLQELYNAGTRTLGMRPAAARRIVAQYAAWPVVETTAQLIVSASLLHERRGFAFRDGRGPAISGS